MTDDLEPQERAGASVTVHDGFEGGAAGVAAWLTALDAAKRRMGVRDRVPANAFRGAHRWHPFSVSGSVSGRTPVDRMTRARGRFRLQVADVVAMAIDAAWRAAMARVPRTR